MSQDGELAATRVAVTVNECPPIPIRDFDWVAFYEGDEETGPRGYGRTEAQAVADLKEICRDH